MAVYRHVVITYGPISHVYECDIAYIIYIYFIFSAENIFTYIHTH